MEEACTWPSRLPLVAPPLLHREPPRRRLGFGPRMAIYPLKSPSGAAAHFSDCAAESEWREPPRWRRVSAGLPEAPVSRVASC